MINFPIAHLIPLLFNVFQLIKSIYITIMSVRVLLSEETVSCVDTWMLETASHPRICQLVTPDKLHLLAGNLKCSHAD